MKMTSARIPLALAAVSLATIAVGVTTVAAAGNSKPVKACANSKQDLSLLSHGKCASGSHKVSIGAKGPKGAKGANGYSAGYSVNQLGTTGNYLTGSYASIVSRSVPAGRYIVTWSVAMSNDSATAGAYQCRLDFSGTTTAPIVNNIGGDASFVGRATTAGVNSVDTEAGTMSIDCSALSGTEIRPGNEEPQTIGAILVNTLP
jgi:hypothetical protein